jgi:hypothetical protein
LGDVEIDFYLITFGPNDKYKLYKNRDIKKIIELANKENYAIISKN